MPVRMTVLFAKLEPEEEETIQIVSWASGLGEDQMKKMAPFRKKKITALERKPGPKNTRSSLFSRRHSRSDFYTIPKSRALFPFMGLMLATRSKRKTAHCGKASGHCVHRLY